MTLPVPKFEIGDVAYSVKIDSGLLREKCPDCCGETVWRATLPNGETIDIACPTCDHGHYGSRGYITDRWDTTATIVQMTVGSVRLDTSEDPNRRIEYMCVETGVGSGRIWQEDKLFATSEEAAAALPGQLQERRNDQEYASARAVTQRKTDRVGRMTAYYRKEIRDGKRRISAGEEGLARIKAKAKEKTA